MTEVVDNDGGTEPDGEVSEEEPEEEPEEELPEEEPEEPEPEESEDQADVKVITRSYLWYFERFRMSAIELMAGGFGYVGGTFTERQGFDISDCSFELSIGSYLTPGPWAEAETELSSTRRHRRRRFRHDHGHDHWRGMTLDHTHDHEHEHEPPPPNKDRAVVKLLVGGDDGYLPEPDNRWLWARITTPHDRGIRRLCTLPLGRTTGRPAPPPPVPPEPETVTLGEEPVRYDLLLRQGDYFGPLDVTVWDADDVPADLTDVEAQAQVRAGPADQHPVMAEFATSIEGQVITVELLSDEAAKLRPGRAVWDLQITEEEQVSTLIAGTVRIRPEVTR